MTDASSRLSRITALLFFSAVLFAGCSEDATEQNAILPTNPPLAGATVRDTTIYAQHDSTFRVHLPMNGALDLVGSGGGYAAVAVIKFVPGSFPARDTVAVFSATLNLHVIYHQGPPGGRVVFNVYRLQRDWDQTTLTWDSLQTGYYDPASPHTTFDGTVSADSQIISVPLDTTMVRGWLRTLTSTDSSKYGIVLVPTPESNTIVGFQSFETDSAAHAPAAVVIAGNVAGTSRDTASYNAGFDTFAGNVDLPLDPSTIAVQAGVMYRSQLRFDLSFLKQGTFVNSAELLLEKKPDVTFITTLQDSAIAAHLVVGTGETAYEGAEYLLKPASAGSTTLSGDVRHIVQEWVRGVNYGVLLRCPLTSERSSFDLLRFHSSQAAVPALRPRIHIVYSVVNLEKKP